MDLALIPPIPNLRDFQPNKVNLLLAHLTSDNEYVSYYKEQSEKGALNVLDNGAHEGKQFSMAELLAIAEETGSKEVVVPDKPHDIEATVDLLSTNLQWLKTKEGIYSYHKADKPRLMAVPQAPLGCDIETFAFSLDQMLDTIVTEGFPLDKLTIGIPLMYDLEGSSLFEIVKKFSSFFKLTDIQIHLLGWSRNIHTPVQIARAFPGAVRSCDTCKPIVYGQAIRKLTPWFLNNKNLVNTPKYPGRPNNYFTKRLDGLELKLAKANSDSFRDAIEDMPRLSESTSTLPAT